MSISPYTHDEGSHFIIRAPSLKNGVAFNGTRYRVTFQKGEARTDSEEKAREFHELYGYEIILPTGHRGFPVPTNVDRDHIFQKPDEEESIKKLILDADSAKNEKRVEFPDGRGRKAKAGAADQEEA